MNPTTEERARELAIHICARDEGSELPTTEVAALIASALAAEREAGRREAQWRIEEKRGGEGRVWYSLQKRDWVAHSIWDTREEAEAAIQYKEGEQVGQILENAQRGAGEEAIGDY